MGRIYALPVSAYVVYVKAMRDLLDVVNVKGPVGDTGSIMGSTKNPIAVGVETTQPVPALTNGLISRHIVHWLRVATVDLPVSLVVLSAHSSNGPATCGTILFIGSLGA
jgi:hypothetical protein